MTRFQLVKAHHLDPWNQGIFALLQWARTQALILPPIGTGPEPPSSKARRAFGSGNLWAWGEGIGGVLGNGDEQNVEAPILVNRLRGVVVRSLSLSCPSQYALVTRVARLAPPSQMTEAACGEFHVVALSSRGECFAWGSNRQFQLGEETVARALWAVDEAHARPNQTLGPPPPPHWQASGPATPSCTGTSPFRSPSRSSSARGSSLSRAGCHTRWPSLSSMKCLRGVTARRASLAWVRIPPSSL